MRLPKFIAASLLAFSLGVNAAAIESTYTPLGGSHWSVAFTITNNGDPAPINEFTIFFSESLFSNLSLAGSPSTWDSLVIQPDTGIPASGYLDGLVLDPIDALDAGGSQSGFIVDFDFLGQGVPSALSFDILDSDFQVISSGRTTISGGGDLPEPTSAILASLGLLALGVSRRALAEEK